MTTYYTPEEVADILKVRKHTVWELAAGRYAERNKNQREDLAHYR